MSKITSQSCFTGASLKGQRRIYETWFFALLALALLLGLSPVRADGPDDEYMQIYNLIQQAANDLEKRFPEDTFVRFTYLPIHRALVALSQNNPMAAIEQLQAAAPYDLAIPGSWFAFFGNIYAPYVRGQAYVKAHRYREAVGEFQKILDHPGIVFADPVRPGALLQLGRALAAAGETMKARTAYQNFLSLWKDADSNIRLLQQARTEYMKLN